MSYKIKKLTERPNLYMIDDFLTGRECTELINAAKRKRMTKGGFWVEGTDQKSQDMSEIVNLKKVQSKTLTRVEDRIEDLTHFLVEWGEPMKILHYGIGGEYVPHNDFFRDKTDPEELRLAQMLFYLNDVEEGGETVFPNVGIKVIPKRGRALLWYNVLGMNLPQKKREAVKIPARLRGDDYTIHHSEPVRKGEKWVAAKLLHGSPPNYARAS